jgi:hypothetical protein
MVTTMPVVLQESMDAGNKWGAELGNRVEQRWSAQGLNQSAQNPSTPRRPLTDEEKQHLLRANGYDPNSHELDDDGNVYERRKTEQQPVQLESKPVTLPSDVRFIIHFSNASGGKTTYFSKEEPKPFGNGFKFRVYPTDTEVTVSGNVQITKIPMKNTPGK